jgi:hypothetical protein
MTFTLRLQNTCAGVAGQPQPGCDKDINTTPIVVLLLTLVLHNLIIK